MRVLITGATGLVGNNCVRYFLDDDDDHDIHVLVRPNHDPRPLKDLPVTPHYADLLQPEQIGPAIPSVDVVIHGAADTHIGRKPRPQQESINVDATQSITLAAQRQSARLIYVSSVDALPAGAPNRFVSEQDQGAAKYSCGYVTTKRLAEQRVLEQIQDGLDAVIVNPGFMLGPWDWKPSSGRMLLQVATRFTPFGPKGGFSVCDARDVVAAIHQLAIKPSAHRRYILAGHNVRYVDAWKSFAQVAGSKGPICAAGPLMRIIAGRWGDLLANLRGAEGDVNSAAIGMSDLYHYYDSSRAQQELGYQIRPLEETARAAWDWFVQHGYAG